VDAVGVGVEAVEVQALDFAAAGADPAGDQVGGALVGIVERVDLFLDCRELVGG
jgi:hypothetical protein